MEERSVKQTREGHLIEDDSTQCDNTHRDPTQGHPQQ